MCLGWLSFTLIHEDMGVAIDINISPSRFGVYQNSMETCGSTPFDAEFSNLTNGKPKVILGNSRPEFKAGI